MMLLDVSPPMDFSVPKNELISYSYLGLYSCNYDLPSVSYHGFAHLGYNYFPDGLLITFTYLERGFLNTFPFLSLVSSY